MTCKEEKICKFRVSREEEEEEKTTFQVRESS